MDRLIRIGIIGDFQPHNRTHVATNEALQHAAPAARATVEVSWVPTRPLEAEGVEALTRYAALWAAPGSPYDCMEGALAGIRFARERRWPFVGT